MFYFILFYFILFYLFYLFFILLLLFVIYYFFNFILLYFILFYFVLFCFILFCFILFYFILFYFILFYFIFKKDGRYSLQQPRSNSANFEDINDFTRIPVIFGGFRKSLSSFAAKCGLGGGSFFSQLCGDVDAADSFQLRRATAALVLFVLDFFAASRAHLADKVVQECGAYLLRDFEKDNGSGKRTLVACCSDVFW